MGEKKRIRTVVWKRQKLEKSIDEFLKELRKEKEPEKSSKEGEENGI